MPPRGPALAAARASARPKILLHLDDIQPTTLVRYDNMLAQLNKLIFIHTHITMDVLLQDKAYGALQIWVMLLMQIHFYCGTAGLSDIGNLLSGLSRQLRLATWRVNVMTSNLESIMKPLWKAFAHWRKIEPYEYRFPLPRKAIHALMGVCIEKGMWQLLLFIALSFHCWLRPAECLSLKWMDVTTSALLEVPGVLRITNPKIKAPATQHVIIESSLVASICDFMRARFCSSSTSAVFRFTTFTLHKEWVSCVHQLHMQKVLNEPQLLSSRVTPSGLRSSGATLDFLRKENLGRVKWRGRWANDAVLKHYLQLGVYHLAAVSFSDKSLQAIDLYDQIYEGFCFHVHGTSEGH